MRSKAIFNAGVSRRQVILGLGALVAFASGVGPRPTLARPLDDVRASGRIRIALYRDYPPFSWRDHGKMVGIDVDLAAAIAKELGLELDIMELTADENVDDDLRNAVWKGHYLGGGVADVMMHVPYDKIFGLRNAEAVLFSPYQRERYALARDPERIDTWTTADLPDVPLGVELDSVPDFHLVSVDNGRLRSNVRHYKTPEDAMDALLSGEVAGVMAALSHIDAHLARHPESKIERKAVTLPPPMASMWDIGMAVKENSRDLAVAVGDAVEAMAKDGRLKAIFAAHGAHWEAIPIDD